MLPGVSDVIPNAAELSVPVSIPEAYGGMAECNGALRLTDAGLRLEFESRDGFLRLIRSGVKEVEIPWAEVADLKLKRGWFSTRLLLTVKSMKALTGVPGTQGSHVVLAVARAHRELARQLAFAANLRICEQVLQRLPPHSPDADAVP